MIYDLHNDLITSGLDGSKQLDYINAAALDKVKGIVLAIWTTKFEYLTETDIKRLLEPFKGLKTDIELSIAFEDLHFIDDGNINLLGIFPLKYVGLTWNHDNNLAGGARGDLGLTELGRRVLKALKNYGIALDTAHLNRKSFYDSLDFHEGKVMNSHCCFDEINAHCRNIDFDQILNLIERGGIIGLTLERSFIGGNQDIAQLINHIDYFVQNFGCDNLCIGSDFNGCHTIDGIECYSDFSALKNGLLKIGYSGDNIDNIFWKNAYNFFNDDKQ